MHSSSSWSPSSTPLSSRSGSSSTPRNPRHCVVVVGAAYNTLGAKTVRFSLERMERTTDSVIMISCLTLIPNVVGGMELPVKSVNDKVRAAAVQHQLQGLHFCLNNIKKLYADREVDLVLDVRTGETNERIVRQVAKELKPLWIIVDCSLLKGRQGKLFQHKLQKDQVIRRVSHLAFVGEGSSDPVTVLSSAYFEADTSVDISTSTEAEFEDHAVQSSSVGCCNGSLTFWQRSTSSSRRTLTREEDQASFRTRSLRHANGNN